MLFSFQVMAPAAAEPCGVVSPIETAIARVCGCSVGSRPSWRPSKNSALGVQQSLLQLLFEGIAMQEGRDRRKGFSTKGAPLRGQQPRILFGYSIHIMLFNKALDIISESNQ